MTKSKGARGLRGQLFRGTRGMVATALVLAGATSCLSGDDDPGSEENGAQGGSATSSSSGGSSNSTGTSSGGTTSGGTSNASVGGALSGDGDVTFQIDLQAGPDRQYDPPGVPETVSPYVYGINGFGEFVATNTQWGLVRQGGNANTAYNWTVDYSNTGADYCFYQGVAASGNVAGRYVDTDGDTVTTALAKNEAFLATVSILDFVAAEFDRNTGWNPSTNESACPGTDADCPNRSNTYAANVVDPNPGGSGYNQALVFASDDADSPAFVPNVLTKGSAFCTPSGTTCTGMSTEPVAQDEFVNFLKVRFGETAQVFFNLDNEPNWWPNTHPELYPNTCSSGTVTWDDIVTRNIAAATAIKAAWSSTKVFGPVVGQDGIVFGGDYSSPHFEAGTGEFADYYLQRMAAASVSAGATLLDSFDVHYYTPGDTDVGCLSAPRLFWDPNATDISAADTNDLDFRYGDHSYWDENWYPRQTIPRLQKKVTDAYADLSAAVPGISFSEYNAGCESSIAGGVAQADLLGIFGREGVFAATAWPLESTTDNFLVAAFDLYRNYDGSGAIVGDTAVGASTTDSVTTSAYAFADSQDSARVDVVAINKSAAARVTTIEIAHAPTLTEARAYQLAGTTAAVSAVDGTPPTVTCSDGTCTLTYTMPPLSATTLVLR